MLKITLSLLILFFNIGLFAQYYPVDFIELSGCDYDNQTGGLTRVRAEDWVYSPCPSSNTISTELSGEVRCEITSFVDHKAFGWRESLGIFRDLRDLSYSFYIDKNALYISENGKVKGQFGKMKKSTQLKIQVTQGKVFYYVDGKVVNVSKRTSSISGLSCSAVVYNKDGGFSKIESSINSRYNCEATIEHVTDLASGTLVITSSGKMNFVEDLLWGWEYFTLPEFSAEIAGLDQATLDGLGKDDVERYGSIYQRNTMSFVSDVAQKYPLFYFNGSSYEEDLFWLGYQNLIIDQKNVAISDNKVLALTNEGKVEYDAFFYSDEESWFNFKVGANAEGVFVGLWDIDKSSSLKQPIYGIEFKNNEVRCYNDGVLEDLVDSYNSEDEFSVEFSNGFVHYYVNGEIERSVVVGEELREYQLIAKIPNSGSFIKEVSSSSKSNGSSGAAGPRIIVEHYECDGTGNAKILASYKGKDVVGSPAVGFRWSKEGVVFALGFNTGFSSVLLLDSGTPAPGTYHLDVLEAGTNNVIVDYDIDIGYKHDWIDENIYAVSPEFPEEEYNNLYYTYSSADPWDTGKGIGNSSLRIGSEGWIEFDLKRYLTSKSEPMFSQMNLNWTNTPSDFSNASFYARQYWLSDNLYSGSIVSGESIDQMTLSYNDLSSIKMVRKDDFLTILSSDQYNYSVIQQEDIQGQGVPKLTAFGFIFRMHIVDTYASYPCITKSLIFSKMSRDVNGEEQVMDPSELKVIYNEPYSTISIKKLEWINGDVILDITPDLMEDNVVVRGENRWIIDISDHDVLDGEIGILRLTNQKNEYYYLRVLLDEQ